MSKTTPEEARALAMKYCLVLYGWDFERLAALIDEVRVVDAEPVGEVERGPVNGFGYATMVVTWKKCSENLPLGVLHKLYTHPAPSQPAAVELPVVAQVVTIAQGSNRGRQIAMLVELENGEKLVKLSDAQAAIAAGKKAS